MKPTVKAWPFESKYLRDFAVVEERRGPRRLFPATEQLPLLSKAIDAEFRAGLTTRLATTDGRGDEWRKLNLWKVANAFCNYLNIARPDHFHVQPYFTPERVTQIAVVQQITKPTPGGSHHWFRFFRGNEFLPDVYLSGKRPVFTGHALERYAQRINTSNGYTVNFLLGELFHTTPALLVVEGNPHTVAFLAGHSMAAMPFEVTPDELIFLTMLSPHEIRRAAAPDPLPRLHFHYGPDYAPPPTSNLRLDQHTKKLLQLWHDKVPRGDARENFAKLQTLSLTRLVQVAERALRMRGHSEVTRVVFHDGLHGPTLLTVDPTPLRDAPRVLPSAPVPSAPPLPDWRNPGPPA